MKPHDVIVAEKPEAILSELIARLHINGPIDQKDLEILSYLKYFHESIFKDREKELMYLLGLFYKIEDPEDLLSLSYSIFSDAITEEVGSNLTPVQASIRNSVIQNKYFSFSAPTSAGKSHVLRKLIKDEQGDIVIVVPSRALIAEYMLIVREMVADRKDILVLQFVDDINKRWTSRKIFIVTPERASEIFRHAERFKPTLFLYDEAQISEEEIRGVTFDAFVRRVEKIFPDSKKVFAHPFVENPEAQLIKHGLSEKSDANAYKQNTVGKIYLRFDSKKKIFESFSPFIDGAHLKKNRYEFPEDVVAKKLHEGGSMLVYVSKASIYDKTFKENFEQYISLCETVTDPKALEIIGKVKELIGAEERESDLVDLMKKGVVVHHGSIPLNVRLLIERFTNANFARICFATSTLVHGVNMPFDIIWVENGQFMGSEEDKTLGLKNLIGRAGRNTQHKNKFDYGFVVVKNIKLFVERFNGRFKLDPKSQLDKNHDDIHRDLSEFIAAAKNDDFNDEYSLPNSKAERLNSEEADNLIRIALDFLFRNGEVMSGSEYRDLSKTKQEILKRALAGIYELSLGRNLFIGERMVLSASITILLWQIQGKSFKELLGLRYSYLTNQKRQGELRNEFKAGDLSVDEYAQKINRIPIEYSVIPHQLPDSALKHKPPSRFGRQTIKNFNYDLVVYDTYDFLDKVISFSLSDVYISAFDQFYIKTNDERARDMVNYFRYGTIENTEILLMRYGYSIEEIEHIKYHVASIDENEIVFKPSIHEPENKNIKDLVKPYLSD